MGKMKKLYKALFGTPEGARKLKEPKRRWEDNIKVYLKEIECEGVN
jgi:hypothetical protein